MTSHPTGSESRNDGVELCGNHPSSTKTGCGRTTGWGTDYQHGPCRDHAEDGYQYDSENTQAVTNGTLVTDEEFYVEHAEFLKTLMGLEKAWENHSLVETVAKKAIKAHDGGPAEYREVFGECHVEGCEKGTNGFAVRTCYDHTDPEGSEESEESNETDVSLDDLDDDSKEELVAEVLDSL